MRARTLAVGLVAMVSFGLSGCGANSAVLQQTGELDLRVSELEQANRQLQLRLDAYEASITLIEDQVTALEVRGVPVQAQVQGSAESPRGGRVVVPELPVYTAQPANYEPAYVEEEQELVVTDEKLAKYFGKTQRQASAPAKAKSSSGGKRVPYEKVVQGDKLSVNPMKADGSGVQGGADSVEAYKEGLRHYRQQDFAGAIEVFEQFLAGNPPPDYVDNALYWLGECHYGLAQYAEAAVYFHKIVEEHPNANKVPDALLKVGLTYQRLNKSDSAIEVMVYLIEAYPDTEAAKVARQRLDVPSES